MLRFGRCGLHPREPRAESCTAETRALRLEKSLTSRMSSHRSRGVLCGDLLGRLLPQRRVLYAECRAFLSLCRVPSAMFPVWCAASHVLFSSATECRVPCAAYGVQLPTALCRCLHWCQVGGRSRTLQVRAPYHLAASGRGCFSHAPCAPAHPRSTPMVASHAHHPQEEHLKCNDNIWSTSLVFEPRPVEGHHERPGGASPRVLSEAGCRGGGGGRRVRRHQRSGDGPAELGSG